MIRFLLPRRPDPAARQEQERARRRLLEQERRVTAVDRANEVISRMLDEDRDDG